MGIVSYVTEIYDKGFVFISPQYDRRVYLNPYYRQCLWTDLHESGRRRADWRMANCVGPSLEDMCIEIDPNSLDQIGLELKNIAIYLKSEKVREPKPLYKRKPNYRELKKVRKILQQYGKKVPPKYGIKPLSAIG